MKNLFNQEKTPMEQMAESLTEYSDPFATFVEEAPRYYFGKERAGERSSFIGSTYDEPEGTPQELTSPEDSIEEPDIMDEPEAEPEMELGGEEALGLDSDEAPEAIERTGDEITIHTDELSPEAIDSLEALLKEPEFASGEGEGELELGDEALEPEGELPGEDEELEPAPPELDAVAVIEPKLEETDLVALAMSFLAEDFGGQVVPADGEIHGVKVISKYQEPTTGEVFVKLADGRVMCVTIGFNGVIADVKRTSFNPAVPQAQIATDKSAIDALTGK